EYQWRCRVCRGQWDPLDMSRSPVFRVCPTYFKAHDPVVDSKGRNLDTRELRESGICAHRWPNIQHIALITVANAVVDAFQADTLRGLPVFEREHDLSGKNLPLGVVAGCDRNPYIGCG